MCVFVTMTLLLNMCHLILEHFIITARFIRLNLLCFATNLYTWDDNWNVAIKGFLDTDCIENIVEKGEIAHFWAISPFSTMFS